VKFNYDRCRKVWDEVFAKENKVRVPEDATIGNSEIDAGLDWLCQGTDSILDFGCGNGCLGKSLSNMRLIENCYSGAIK